MKVSIPRLRRIRFKDGRTIEVLRQPEKSRWVQDSLTASCAKASEWGGAGMAGFALVAWSRDGEVYVNFENDGSRLPAGGVPQYVRDVLLAEVASRWAKD